MFVFLAVLALVLSVGSAAWIAEHALRRTRRQTRYGRYAPWIHPRGRLAAPLNWVADSRLLRTLCERIPPVAFASDMRDVVYVNYVVDARRIEPLIPPGLELQRIGEAADQAMLTFLSYRHGHLGPASLGRWRRLLPSPLQSNWRVYVHHRRTGALGVHFLSTAIDRTFHALGARMTAEALPMHVLGRASLLTSEDGRIDLLLGPGHGSAPDAEAHLAPLPEWPTDGPWRCAFSDYEQMLAYCVPQDRALSVQPWYGRITRQEISLGIPLDVCVALTGPVHSAAAGAITGDAEPFSFLVPLVKFRFENEEHDPI
ncbi:DUF2071 domain-containing protein [Streptomyces aurantiacus]|uniref:Uncharacterized protein n=1 Tax=Streptomyces aurantiacus TaxID=47760 RepID=A0A7G1NRW1_9ACTN|nr:DUF2071 domain-containing protein [Streptomyces aurantiacus]BCL25242.1 hypothetical protein GCM10017557_01010 [Streptomyces aurantiacus]